MKESRNAPQKGRQTGSPPGTLSNGLQTRDEEPTDKQQEENHRTVIGNLRERCRPNERACIAGRKVEEAREPLCTRHCHHEEKCRRQHPCDQQSAHSLAPESRERYA
jgi:hypothetical protein